MKANEQCCGNCAYWETHGLSAGGAKAPLGDCRAPVPLSLISIKKEYMEPHHGEGCKCYKSYNFAASGILDTLFSWREGATPGTIRAFSIMQRDDGVVFIELTVFDNTGMRTKTARLTLEQIQASFDILDEEAKKAISLLT